MTPADYPAEEEVGGGPGGSKSGACITCGDPGAVRRRKSGAPGWWGEQLHGTATAQLLGGTGEQQAAARAPARIREKMRLTSTADLSKCQPAPVAMLSIAPAVWSLHPPPTLSAGLVECEACSRYRSAHGAACPEAVWGRRKKKGGSKPVRLESAC